MSADVCAVVVMLGILVFCVSVLVDIEIKKGW